MSMGAPRIVALVLQLGVAAMAMGCATGQKQVQGAHFTLTHPEFWQVKSVGKKDGEATVVLIGQFGVAVIDDGTGAMDQKEANYDSVTADVEARVYGWTEPAETTGVAEPAEAVAQLLAGDEALKLGTHLKVAEQPFECNKLKKKYKVFGVQQSVLDLVRRPGWRAIVAGGRSGDTLVGVVARVEFEQDGGRYCHNLSNLQVQLQNLLDGVAVAGPAPGGAAKPGAEKPGGQEPAAGEATSKEGKTAAGTPPADAPPAPGGTP
jgi:hypothetical protein